jgi:hypothetical protein
LRFHSLSPKNVVPVWFTGRCSGLALGMLVNCTRNAFWGRQTLLKSGTV